MIFYGHYVSIDSNSRIDHDKLRAKNNVTIGYKDLNGSIFKEHTSLGNFKLFEVLYGQLPVVRTFTWKSTEKYLIKIL